MNVWMQAWRDTVPSWPARQWHWRMRVGRYELYVRLWKTLRSEAHA